MCVRQFVWTVLLTCGLGSMASQTAAQTDAAPETKMLARVGGQESQFIGVPFLANTVVTHQPEIGFPLDPILRKQAGTVVVAVLVGEDGVPVRHRIVSAEPPLIFNRHVEAALPEFRFGIASRDGKPLAYETRLTLNFAPKP